MHAIHTTLLTQETMNQTALSPITFAGKELLLANSETARSTIL